MQDGHDSSERLTGLYDELEPENAVVSRTGLRLFIYLAGVCLKFGAPLVLVPTLTFLVFTRSFEMPWGWALLPCYLFGGSTLSISLLNAPIFVAKLPPLIGFRMRALYGLLVGSLVLILATAPFFLQQIQAFTFAEWLPWPVQCTLSMVLPLILCCILGSIFVAPRVDSLKYQGGRSRTYREQDGTIVHVQDTR